MGPDEGDRLRRFIASTTVPLVLLDQELMCVAVSVRFLSDDFPDRATILGRTLFEVFCECPPRVQTACRRGLAGETLHDAEDCWTASDGSLRWWRFAVHPSPRPDGTIDSVVLFLEDTTGRKNAERDHHRGEERLRAIMATAFSGIITIDSKGFIGNINHAAERILGYEAGELVGENIKIIMPAPYCDHHDEYLSRYQETRVPHIIGTIREVQAQRKDGSLIDVALAISEVDHLGLYTGILHDITERKQLQRHVLDVAAEEQQRIALELHDGIQQELTALSLFAGVVRQDALQLARASAPTTRDTDMRASVIRHLQDGIDRLVSGLADTQRHVMELARGILPLPIETESLSAALESLAASVRPTIHCTCACSPDVAIADNTRASHVYRIAQEALTNAVRHGKAESVRIALTPAASNIVLTIDDDGRGFDRSNVTGGMGLRTMEYRASLIGGTLTIGRSSLGGTAVRCELPRPIEAVAVTAPPKPA